MKVKIIYTTENGRTLVARYDAESEDEAVDAFEFTIAQTEFVEIVDVITEKEE